MTALHVLFVCSLNRWRSPTAEQIFADYPGIACTSAGINRGAENELTPELLDWADLIFVMERQHKTKLSQTFQQHLQNKKLVCLNIPDRYHFMDPTLIELLQNKVSPFLPHSHK